MVALLVLALAITPQERYEELIKQYDAPLRTYLNDTPRAKTASEPFLKLARENPTDRISVEALHWVAKHTLFTPMAGEAMDLLARDHAQDQRLRRIIPELDRLYGGPFPPMEKLLRAVLKESPDRDARAWACLALGRFLADQREDIERRRVQFLLFRKGAKVPYVIEPKETDEDLEKMAGEAEVLFERVIAEFGDIPGLSGSAKADLSELHSLALGQNAPEIEGVDVDGNRFRLSDYRGKVVVLEFWNHEGCGPCRAMYPDLRDLVKRMQGKPFALLAVNSDDDLDTLKELRDEGQVTWRFWCDGPSDSGPILRRWNVGGWPTVYVLDQKGVIRHKIAFGVGLIEAVESLVGKASP